MPTLLIAMTFFSFAQFLGSIYSANKKTGMAFVTNLLGVVVNLTLSLLLIKPFGVIGCAAATAVSYFVLWVSRVFDTHKIIPIKHSIFKTVISVLLLITQCVLISFEFPFAYPISAICLLAIVLIFIKTFGELLTFGLSIVKKVLRKGA